MSKFIDINTFEIKDNYFEVGIGKYSLILG